MFTCPTKILTDSIQTDPGQFSFVHIAHWEYSPKKLCMGTLAFSSLLELPGLDEQLSWSFSFIFSYTNIQYVHKNCKQTHYESTIRSRTKIRSSCSVGGTRAAGNIMIWVFVFWLEAHVNSWTELLAHNVLVQTLEPTNFWFNHVKGRVNGS